MNMRRSTALLLLMLAPYSLAASEDHDFSGAWTGWQCPSGLTSQSGKCANFVLEIFQRQNQLCGSHVYATAGAQQIDEGGAPSITGTVTDGVASVTLDSGVVPPSQIKAEMRIANGKLQWKRLDSPEGNYLLPLSAQLIRSKHDTLFHPFFAQRLKAVCSTVGLNAPAMNPAAPLPAPPAR